MGFIQFVKSTIRRLRAAGKTENEISGILEDAAEKSTVNRETIKDKEPETALKPNCKSNYSDSLWYAIAEAGITAKEALKALETMRIVGMIKPIQETNNWRKMHGLAMRRKCSRRGLRHGKRERTDSRANNADMA